MKGTKRIDRINSAGKLVLHLLCIAAYFVFAEIVLELTVFKGTRTDFDYYRNLTFSPEEAEKAEKFMIDIISLGESREISIPGTIIFRYKPAVRESFTLNSDGFRDEEFKKKEKDEFRIAIYGDSKIFGFALQKEDTTPYIVEKKLTEHFGRKITVLNMGVEGHDIQRAIATAKYFNEKVEPDMIVFFSWIVDLYNTYEHGNVDWEPFVGGERLIPGVDANGNVGVVERFKLLKTLQHTYLVDFAKLLARLQGRDVAHLPLSPQREEAAGRFPEIYLDRMKDATIYFERQGIPSLFILQPLIHTKSPLNGHERYVMYLAENVFPGMNVFSAKCINGVLEAVKTGKYGSNIIDHSHVFQGVVDTVFFDGMHYVPKFSRIEAEHIADELIKTLEAGKYFENR